MLFRLAQVLTYCLLNYQGTFLTVMFATLTLFCICYRVFVFHDFSAFVSHYSSPPFQFFLCSVFLTAGLCPFLPDMSLPNAVFPLLHGVWRSALA